MKIRSFAFTELPWHTAAVLPAQTELRAFGIFLADGRWKDNKRNEVDGKKLYITADMFILFSKMKVNRGQGS